MKTVVKNFLEEITYYTYSHCIATFKHEFSTIMITFEIVFLLLLLWVNKNANLRWVPYYRLQIILSVSQNVEDGNFLASNFNH